MAWAIGAPYREPEEEVCVGEKEERWPFNGTRRKVGDKGKSKQFSIWVEPGKYAMVEHNMNLGHHIQLQNTKYCGTENADA
jgi:hypothetical protein